MLAIVGLSGWATLRFSAVQSVKSLHLNRESGRSEQQQCRDFTDGAAEKFDSRWFDRHEAPQHVGHIGDKAGLADVVEQRPSMSR